MTTLVVSPHLDDAVLSIPGFIHTCAAAGEPILVLTAFTEGDANHITRRAEDRTALALLGATPLHLGLRDAPQRRGVPPSFRDLILGDPDPADVAAVTRTLVDRITALAPDRLLLPLAVGEHLDHRIVHAIHPHFTRPVGFYADLPYARIEHALLARLLRLGASLDAVPVTVSPAAVHEYIASAAATPHILAYLPAGEREACLRAAAAPLLTAAPRSGLDLRHECLHFPPATRRLAIAAARAYASQLPDLFGARDPARSYPEPYTEHIYWRSPARPVPLDPDAPEDHHGPQPRDLLAADPDHDRR